jgi:hypothetical protein
MSKTIDLTISDRVAIGRYINLIRCTLPIRLVIDDFNDKFVPTMDELKKAGAVIEGGQLAEIKNDFVRSYSEDDVPAVIKKGIEDFIAEKESNKNADPAYIERITTPLKKLI